MDHHRKITALHRTWRLIGLAGLATALVLGAAPAVQAQVTQLMVTKTADTADGACNADCSLREAIIAANASGGSTKIVVPAGTYSLTLVGADEDASATGDLDVATDMRIVGAGETKTVIDGNRSDRVFDILSGKVSLSKLTVKKGEADVGAGIRNAGTLELKDLTIRDNQTFGGGSGAGMLNRGALHLDDVTITGNTATSDYENERLGSGGGIYNEASGIIRLRESTISNNAADQGAGIYNDGTLKKWNRARITGNIIASDLDRTYGGGIYNTGSAELDNSLISKNHIAGTDAVGGGVLNEGYLLLHNSIVSGNTSEGGAGGIENNGGQLVVRASTLQDNIGESGGIRNGGSALITESTISGNQAAGDGGGIRNGNNLTVINSTISGNQAAGDGGGVISVNDSPDAVVSLNNVTIANNIADSDHDGIGDGGGLDNAQGVGSAFSTTLYATNTIVATNIDTGGEAPDCAGTLTSGGHNLIQNTTGCSIIGDTAGNITGLDPRLKPLANNGGPTQTHAFKGGSPAIDAAGAASCTATDQRGVARPQGAACDIGAYERK